MRYALTCLVAMICAAPASAQEAAAPAGPRAARVEIKPARVEAEVGQTMKFTAVGYDDEQSWFIVRNAWGTGWGMKGYFTLPYTYLLDENLSDDFWTIKGVSE